MLVNTVFLCQLLHFRINRFLNNISDIFCKKQMSFYYMFVIFVAKITLVHAAKSPALPAGTADRVENALRYLFFKILID